jgi:hypothetical protein
MKLFDECKDLFRKNWPSGNNKLRTYTNCPAGWERSQITLSHSFLPAVINIVVFQKYSTGSECEAIYSYRKASIGFLVAALQLCQLTVIKAIPSARIPANPNIHQLNSVLYAKL